MSDNLFDRLCMIEQYATKQEKVIIDYIRKTPVMDMVLLSITEFAERAGIGEATMLRFCRKLQLKGYSEFRFLLSHSINAEAEENENEADQIYHAMVSSLKATHDLLDYSQIRIAAEKICSARKLYAFGSGNSGLAAQEFCNKVMRYGINCVFLPDNHFQIITTSTLDENDALILFSVSGGTKDIVHIAQMAAGQNVPLIIITNHLKSPLAKYATALLYGYSKSMPLNSGSIISKISQLYVIDVLSREIFKQLGQKAEDTLQRTVLSIMEKEV